MGIHPVPIIQPANENLDSRDSGREQSSRRAPVRSDSGSAPEPETAGTQNISTLSEMPQDEVQVQRDNQANGEIVIRYMDHAGNLILQVPSEQVLNVTRSIDQDLEREQQVRLKAEQTVEGHQEGESGGH